MTNDPTEPSGQERCGYCDEPLVDGEAHLAYCEGLSGPDKEQTMGGEEQGEYWATIPRLLKKDDYRSFSGKEIQALQDEVRRLRRGGEAGELGCPKCGYIDWRNHPALRETIDFIRQSRRARTTSRELADGLDLSIQAASNRLQRLRDAEIVREVKRRGVPGGGRESVYELLTELAPTPTSEKERESAILPQYVVDAVLAARDALIQEDYDEAYHQLYWLAETYAEDPFEPWAKLEQWADPHTRAEGEISNEELARRLENIIYWESQWVAEHAHEDTLQTAADRLRTDPDDGSEPVAYMVREIDGGAFWVRLTMDRNEAENFAQDWHGEAEIVLLYAPKEEG